jgi:3D (Asp-Asp-Asp) domain-containing protein
MRFNLECLQNNGLAMARTVLAVIVPYTTIVVPIFGAHSPSKNGPYRATAYSVSGTTASGERTHRHVVAADPEVLPLGSRIKVRSAGKYSGEYVVADTGAKIVGHRLDIYMPSTPECLRFGSRPVEVQVLQLGDGTRAATKQADQVIKHDVEKDIAQGVVGNAATEVDLTLKGVKTLATIESSPPEK